mmetsp:Transcript_2808/g.4968  ORF Transcript_2808/g.4968 Transcript_2808/m.4968 type:complete len:241 (-) Transcript_2808:792-1514(-)
MHHPNDHEGPEEESGALQYSTDQHPQLVEHGHDPHGPGQASQAQHAQCSQASEEVDGISQGFQDPNHQHPRDPDHEGVEHVHRLKHPDPGVCPKPQEIFAYENHHKDVLRHSDVGRPVIILFVHSINPRDDGIHHDQCTNGRFEAQGLHHLLQRWMRRVVLDGNFAHRDQHTKPKNARDLLEPQGQRPLLRSLGVADRLARADLHVFSSVFHGVPTLGGFLCKSLSSILLDPFGFTVVCV